MAALARGQRQLLALRVRDSVIAVLLQVGARKPVPFIVLARFDGQVAAAVGVRPAKVARAVAALTAEELSRGVEHLRDRRGERAARVKHAGAAADFVVVCRGSCDEQQVYFRNSVGDLMYRSTTLWGRHESVAGHAHKQRDK